MDQVDQCRFLLKGRSRDLVRWSVIVWYCWFPKERLFDTGLSPLFLGRLKILHKPCLVAFSQKSLEGLCLSKAKSKHATPIVMIIDL
jgi:hypothetical protein